jgi:hypothetical protein
VTNAASQEWQQGVAEALKANLLNGSTSPTKAKPSSSKSGMQARDCCVDARDAAVKMNCCICCHE